MNAFIRGKPSSRRPSQLKSDRRGLIARASEFGVLAFVVGAGFLAASCGEDRQSSLTAVAGSPEVPSTTSATASDFELRITEEGISPATVEVPEGAVVWLTNDSETGRTVMVSGFIEGDGEMIKPGETLELALPKVGAYIVTSPGDTDFTASITVLAATGGR